MQTACRAAQRKVFFRRAACRAAQREGYSVPRQRSAEIFKRPACRAAQLKASQPPHSTAQKKVRCVDP